MFKRVFATAGLLALSACALQTNEAIHEIGIGMSVAEAEAHLGEPTSIHKLAKIEGTVAAKDITRECRTYQYVDGERREQSEFSRTDRYTWVVYNSGKVAWFADNGYGTDEHAFCFG